MKTLNTKEYYASEQEYYLDNENTADCKLQVSFCGLTLYGLNESEDQFFISGAGEDVFYVDCNLEEFVKNWTGIDCNIKNPIQVLELIADGWEIDTNNDGQLNNDNDDKQYYDAETDEYCEI